MDRYNLKLEFKEIGDVLFVSVEKHGWINITETVAYQRVGEELFKIEKGVDYNYKVNKIPWEAKT